MKKIISALVLGAMTIGFAAADISVGLNYRNGVELFKYVNTGANGRATDDYGNTYVDSGYDKAGASYNLFNLTGWNAGKDNLSLKASGDIFSLAATIQPTIGSNADVFHILTVDAEFGNFYVKTGWNGDGVMNFRVKRFCDNGNEEGKVGETFKLGSAFTGSEGICANNQTSFGTGRNLFAYAGYTVVFNDKANLKMQIGYISDRNIDSLGTATWKNYPGWSLFLAPRIKKVLAAEVFVKGHMNSKEQQTIVTGAYFTPLVLNVLADSSVGGSVVIFDGKLMEYNFDLRTLWEVNDKLQITTMHKFAKLCKKGSDADDPRYAGADGAAVGALAGLTGFKSSQVLWNIVNARYVVNPTVTLIGTIGELTDLDDGFQGGRESKDGTQLYVYPHAQFYANPKISVSAGVVAAFGGLGANEEANKDVDVIVNVPVMIRVKL